jgi:SsrA-binding protein
MAEQKKRKLIAENRRARRDYDIEEVFEAGIALVGSEVKSLRLHSANIAESYAYEDGGEIWLANAHIPEYGPANRMNHEPRRIRKLLLKKREMAKLIGAVRRDGRTLVPLNMYFNQRGIAKLELALAKGRKAPDKRAAEAKRDWGRQKARLIRERG